MSVGLGEREEPQDASGAALGRSAVLLMLGLLLLGSVSILVFQRGAWPL